MWGQFAALHCKHTWWQGQHPLVDQFLDIRVAGHQGRHGHCPAKSTVLEDEGGVGALARPRRAVQPDDLAGHHLSAGLAKIHRSSRMQGRRASRSAAAHHLGEGDLLLKPLPARLECHFRLGSHLAGGGALLGDPEGGGLLLSKGSRALQRKRESATDSLSTRIPDPKRHSHMLHVRAMQSLPVRWRPSLTMCEKEVDARRPVLSLEACAMQPPTRNMQKC